MGYLGVGFQTQQAQNPHKTGPICVAHKLLLPCGLEEPFEIGGAFRGHGCCWAAVAYPRFLSTSAQLWDRAEMIAEPSEPRIENASIRVAYVNLWSQGATRLDDAVFALGVHVSEIPPDVPNSMFAQREPDVVLVGFGNDSRDSDTFISTYRSSDWFRRVPLIALLETKNDDALWMCMESGCDDAMLSPIKFAQLNARTRLWALRHRMRDLERLAVAQTEHYSRRAAHFAEIIVPLGIAMMAESDFDVLLEMILTEARRYCNADGGTLYLVSDERTLEFKTIINESMGIKYPAQRGVPVPFAAIPLPAEGAHRSKHIACHVALTGETVNVNDVHRDDRFDFSGVIAFDRDTGYRTRSLLTMPLRDKAGRVIGALQLINALDRQSGEVIAFDPVSQTFVESLSLLAGQALESYRKMARLRRQADALVITIDAAEKAKQVSTIASSDYFRTLKAKAGILRNGPQPMERATA